MKVTILDDYHDTIRTLGVFKKLAGHDVKVWNDHLQDTGKLAERLKDTEALVLIRERTKIRAPLIEKLRKLKLISQRSVYPHIDVDACTKQGVLVCSNMHAGTPSYSTSEMTWALITRAVPGQDVMPITTMTFRTLGPRIAASTMASGRNGITRNHSVTRTSTAWNQPP